MALFSNLIRKSLPLIKTSSARNFCDYGKSVTEKCINQVTLLGRVGTDPTLRGSEAHPVLLFSMATNQTYRKEESIEQQTQWHRIAIFKPHLRETCTAYLRKGTRVLVQGRLTYGELSDKDGITRTIATVMADDLIFLSSTLPREAE